MTSLRWVEFTQGGDATPAKGQICEVAMLSRARSWPEVEGGSGPNAVVEVSMKAGIVVEEVVEVVGVVLVKFWRPAE